MTASPASAATVTVAIPAFNEEANLVRLTEQVLAEPWTDRLVLRDVILVDDCSTDRTPVLAEALARDHPTVKVIRHAQRLGKNAGIRDAIAAFQSDVFVVLDADVRLGPSSLIKTIEFLLSDSSLGVTSCINEPLPPRSWRERASRFQAILFAELFRYGAGSLARVYAMRRHTIRSLALPDDTADDLYIARWLHNQGYGFGAPVDARLYVRCASGLRDFAKQTVRHWHAAAALDRLLPANTAKHRAGRRDILALSLIRAARREPLGCALYVVWRGIVTLTPPQWWLPIVDLSRHDTCLSTKDVNA